MVGPTGLEPVTRGLGPLAHHESEGVDLRHCLAAAAHHPGPDPRPSVDNALPLLYRFYMMGKSMGHPRPPWVRAFVGMASLLALVLSGVSLAGSAHAESEVPIHGQALTRPETDRASNEQDVLISVHGVRRVESATMVYWSVGYMPDTRSGSDRRELLESFGSEATLSPLRSGGEAMGNVAVIDVTGKKAYTTLYTSDSLHDCVCQAFTSALPDEPEPGTAYVASSAIAPIPEGLDTVTVRVAGQAFPDVPVEEGPMEPAVETGEPIVVGTGWPEVDTTAINEVPDPSEYILPLTTHANVDNSAMSKRSEADSRSLDLSADVLFDTDEATLTSKADREIQTAADAITAADVTGTLTVTGHTDSRGTASHNQDLSERRAQAVADALGPLLPSDVTLTTDGKGQSEPVADNDTDEGRALNRRATITLPGDA